MPVRYAIRTRNLQDTAHSHRRDFLNWNRVASIANSTLIDLAFNLRIRTWKTDTNPVIKLQSMLSAQVEPAKFLIIGILLTIFPYPRAGVLFITFNHSLSWRIPNEFQKRSWLCKFLFTFVCWQVYSHDSILIPKQMPILAALLLVLFFL